MSANLRAMLDTMDDGDMLTVRTVRRLLAQDPGADTPRLTWVRSRKAAPILDMPESTVRASCLRWSRMDDPPVRVRKAGDKDGSPWELCEEDCWRLRRETGGGPREVSAPPSGVEVDEREATTAYYERLAFDLTEPKPCRDARKKSHGATSPEPRGSTA